jgi:HNH endonuclease
VVDTVELAKINALKQAYFVPFYREIVEHHPAGIDSRVVKAQVAQLLVDRFDIDIEDGALFGENVNGSRAVQWANNLISNYVLDEYMLVAHRGRGQGATLWPGATDNSVPLGSPSGGIGATEAASLNNRAPAQIQSTTGNTWRRSPELANLVRVKNDYKCAVQGSDCVEFEGRDQHPYIEVHHIVPIAFQTGISVNLDRTSNMAPLCAGCHKRAHRGASGPAGEVVDGILEWFATTHGVTFEVASEDLGFGVSAPDLMAMYGVMSGET